MNTEKKQKEPKSPEELAQIAFLDELRATDHDAQPERPLAVVVKVSSVRNVPKANEKYALAEISDGTSSWLVCLPRGLVKVRQRALFVSEDAILPMDERYICGELSLAHRRNIKGGVAMLTLNVRRNVYRANQGVLYPLSTFPELKKNTVGDIVSDALHLLSEKRMEAEKEARRIAEEKRVATDRAARKIRIEEHRRDERTQELRENHVVLGPAPEFVQRTCLDAAGNMPELFEQYTDCPFEVTEKMLGVNLSVYCDRVENSEKPVGVCLDGRAIRDDPGEFHWSLIRRLGVEAALLQCPHDLVLEGVVIGPGIRGGRLVGYRTNEFRVFDIYDLTDDRALLPDEREAFCRGSKVLHVPVIARRQCVFAECVTPAELKAYSDGRTYYGYPRRGIVLRSEDPDLDIWVQVRNPRFHEGKKNEGQPRRGRRGAEPEERIGATAGWL